MARRRFTTDTFKLITQTYPGPSAMPDEALVRAALGTTAGETKIVLEETDIVFGRQLNLDALALLVGNREVAARLVVVQELCNRMASRINLRQRFAKPVRDMVSLYATLIRGTSLEPNETLYIMSFDNQNRLISVRRLARGAHNYAIIETPEVIRAALAEDAKKVAVAHNHPSGSFVPSRQDITMTDGLKEGFQAVGIMFLDHIIITSHGVYSVTGLEGMTWSQIEYAMENEGLND